MTITAKVRKRMIENGRLVHAIVQGESNATTILFRIEGETDLVAEETLFLYLLYKRPNDQTVQLPILLDYTIEDGVILATFTPGAYFTADAGPVEISVIATSSAAELGGSGEVTNTLLWSSFPAWLLVAPSQLADSSTIIEENVFTQYLAELEALDADAKDYASDAEEYAKGTRSDGGTVTHATDNAKYYKNLAKDWAMKTGGPVEGVEMSAKVYAASSQNYATESQQWANKMDGKVLGTDYSSKYYANDAKDSAYAAGQSAESAAASAQIVEDHAEAIEAIADDLTNIDSVAGKLTEIGTVAGDLTNIDAVAGNKTNIDAVNANKTNIDIVAGKATEITTVAGKAAEVTTVAGIASDVTKVAAVDDDVSAVAAIDSDVSAVAAVASDVTAVSGALSDISDVATDLNDDDSAIRAVAADMTGVSAVAADLDNIDAVAADLANIDAADDHALEAEGWAAGTQNGVPVTSGSPYYENNAKYYGQEIPNLKDAIQANSKRITNLETKAGDEIPVTYPSTTYGMDGVPASVAPYGKVRELIMNSRVRNQLARAINSTNYFVETGSGATISDGEITISGNAVVSEPSGYRPSSITGHYYLLAFNAQNNVSGTTAVRNFLVGSGYQETTIPQSSGYTQTAVVFSCTNGKTDTINFQVTSYASGSLKTKDIILCDLNVYFNTTDLSFLGATDSAKLVTIQRDYPELLIPSDYDTGTRVDTTYSAVKSEGVNIWDERWKMGHLIAGQEVSDGTYRLISTEFSECKPLTEYYYYCSINSGCTIYVYDINKNYLGYDYDSNERNTAFTTRAGAYFFKIQMYAVYGSSASDVYKNDIQICDNSLPVAVKQEHHAHMTDTITLPNPVTGKSAGSVHQIYYPETGEMTEPLGEIDMGDIVWDSYSSNIFRSDTLNGLIFVDLSQTDVPDIICGVYVPTPWNTVADKAFYVKPSSISNQYDIAIRDTSKTSADLDSNLKAPWLVGKKLYYRLATPNPNSHATDPVLDPFMKVEGNGTIRPVQTQTTQIDSAMSVDYLGV